MRNPCISGILNFKFVSEDVGIKEKRGNERKSRDEKATEKTRGRIQGGEFERNEEKEKEMGRRD